MGLFKKATTALQGGALATQVLYLKEDIKGNTGLTPLDLSIMLSKLAAVGNTMRASGTKEVDFTPDYLLSLDLNGNMVMIPTDNGKTGF